jgi:uncharacterized membrane protein SpoIIM required for sporulation
MREARFIKKNVDKWNEYQQTEPTDPDETAERFVTLIDDLSYSKTFYPHSQVTRWINGIAAGIYQRIYKNRKEKYTKIFSFWRYDLPFLFRRYHKIFLFSFILFFVFGLIGWFSSQHDDQFIRMVLGDNYVNETEANIARGDPFGIYRENNMFSAFIILAVHNTSVAFKMFLSGLTLSILNIWLVFYNGLMLGTFQYMFFAKGLGWQSVLVIWTHGVMEISSFIIAATSGFIISNSILFPGTYSRFISFRRGVKDASKIMITLIPMFFIAAFFESFITQLVSNTLDNDNKTIGIPVWAGVLILIFFLTFIIWYFVIYPIRLHKKGYQPKANTFLN